MANKQNEQTKGSKPTATKDDKTTAKTRETKTSQEKKSSGAV